jgi:hypothetical protein
MGKKRMAMRMVTIFVALIVCGMFFPDPVRGDEYVSSDQGLDVDFEDVVVGEGKTIPLGIRNESDHPLILYPLFNMDAACDFTVTEPGGTELGRTELEPGAILNVQVTFSPSAVGSCNAELQIMYTGSPGGVVVINFTANGIEEASETFIEIGGFNTGVLDREDEDGEFISDMISECQETAYNNGHMVRCISRLTTHLRWQGILSREEKSALLNASWKAAMSNIMQEMKTAKRSGRRDHRSSRSWWRVLHHHWRR